MLTFTPVRSLSTRELARPFRRHSASRTLTPGVQASIYRQRPSRREPPEDNGRQYEVITFVTADGLVRLPGRLLQPTAGEHLKRLEAALPSWEEQGLCIGNVFYIAAINGTDPSRRVNLLGFCRSADMVSEAVGDAVVRSGGEIMHQTCELKSGLHENLQMLVAVPRLFGVPPLVEHLQSAVEIGGGYVDQITREWRLT